jgi:hypothetical protein
MLRLHGAYLREQQALAAQRGRAAAIRRRTRWARRGASWRRGATTSHARSKAEELAAEIERAGGGAEWLRQQGVRVRSCRPT